VEELAKWKTRNTMSCAQLLVEFFEFYALGFRQADYVISLRVAGGLAKAEKQWKGKKLAIEDPFAIKRTLTRSVSGLASLDFIDDCFKIGYLYFGTIQTSLGPVITKILVPDASPERKTTTHQQSPHQGLEMSLLMEKLEFVASAAEDNADGLAVAPSQASKVLTLKELEKKLKDEEEEEEEEEVEHESLCNETLETFIDKYGRELTPQAGATSYCARP